MGSAHDSATDATINEKPEGPGSGRTPSVSNHSGEKQSVAAGGSGSGSGNGTGNGNGAVNEYPTGLRLVLLAGASIMGVFLISLDQVSIHYLLFTN